MNKWIVFALIDVFLGFVLVAVLALVRFLSGSANETHALTKFSRSVNVANTSYPYCPARGLKNGRKK